MSAPEIDHAFRESVTLMLVRDALEANRGHLGEALMHLLDVAGSLIVHAHRHNGADGKGCLTDAVDYLTQQVEAHLGAQS